MGAENRSQLGAAMVTDISNEDKLWRKIFRSGFFACVFLSIPMLWGWFAWPINSILTSGPETLARGIARLPNFALGFGLLWASWASCQLWYFTRRHAVLLALAITASIFLLTPYAINTPAREAVRAYLAQDTDWDGRLAPGRNIAVPLSRFDENDHLPGCNSVCQSYLREKPGGSVTLYRLEEEKYTSPQSPDDAPSYLFSPPNGALTFAASPRQGDNCPYAPNAEEGLRYSQTVLGAFDIEDGFCIHRVPIPAQLDLIETEHSGRILINSNTGQRLLGTTEQNARLRKNPSSFSDGLGVIRVTTNSAYRRSEIGPELIYRYSTVLSYQAVAPLSISKIDGVFRYYDTDLGLERRDVDDHSAWERRWALPFSATP